MDEEVCTVAIPIAEVVSKFHEFSKVKVVNVYVDPKLLSLNFTVKGDNLPMRAGLLSLIPIYELSRFNEFVCED
jgi:hypothetical protein